MGDINRKIELFNRTYALAWSELSKRIKGPSPAVELAAVIRSKIHAGYDDPVIIAAEAVRSLVGSRS